MSDSAPIIDEVLEPPVDALRQLCYATPDFAKRYEGWEVIGQGAFATVVKVSLLGEPVAVKVFTNLNEEGRARFRSEFASTVRLNSPHLVRTYSAFETGSIAWIEMEAVDGPNLEDELSRREHENNPFPFNEALDIAIALATVVGQAHEQGIVHRDIKPANILLPGSRKPVAKLGDFGIARFMDAAKLTATGGFPGTPKWAAPEVFALRPRVGPAADVYSLSLCLYALFTTNRYPWILGDDASPGGFMAAHLKSRPLRMRVFERSVPESLDSIIAAGLEKRPDKRPTASEMTVALSNGSARDIIRPAAIGSPEAVTQSWARYLRGATVVLTSVLGLLVLGWAYHDGRSWKDGLTRALQARPPAGPSAGPQETRAAQANGPSPADVRVTASSRFVRIQNGNDRLSQVELVVLGTHGQRHAFRLPDSLQPQESVDVALDGLRPSAIGESLEEARVSATSPNGLVATRILLEARHE